jgi:hypothetical protein
VSSTSQYFSACVFVFKFSTFLSLELPNTTCSGVGDAEATATVSLQGQLQNFQTTFRHNFSRPLEQREMP